MKVDLHNHTIHSDGKLTSEQLIKRAISNNVDIFAITDHDSVYGCDEIEKLASGTGVKVIKGMELSTYYKGESVHIVCLFKNNIVPDEMLKFSNELKERRINRAILMMNKIHDIYGVNINIEKLLEKGEIITRANMLRNIAEENDITLEEARFYVSDKSKAYIPSTKMSVSDGLDFAKKSGAIVILAHPCLLKEEYVEEILKPGFDGIEARYANPKNDENKFIALAKKYNLFISAGSDCHGDSTHADIGTATLSESEFEPIAKLLNFSLGE